MRMAKYGRHADRKMRLTKCGYIKNADVKTTNDHIRMMKSSQVKFYCIQNLHHKTGKTKLIFFSKSPPRLHSRIFYKNFAKLKLDILKIISLYKEKLKCEVNKKFGRTLKSCGNTRLRFMLPQHFSFSQTSHGTCFLFLKCLLQL